MIKYNSNTINDWNFGDDNIIKVYKHGAVCYYKITSGDTPTPVQEPCYAVVDDITQYSDTEFEDVFNKADGKWYKLNNLSQYEEYGVYGSGRTITYYEGKLTIDEDTIPSPSRLPSGYTEVEYIRQNSNYNAYINTNVLLFDNDTNSYTVTTRLASEFHSNLGCATIISAEVPVSPYYGMGYRYKCSSTVDQLEFFGGDSNYSSSVVNNGDGTRTVTFQSTGNTSWTSNAPLSLLCSFSDTSFTTPFRYADATIYSSTIVKNGTTVRDYVPAKRDSDDKYGLYDLITDTFFTSPNGNNFSGGNEVNPPSTTATCEFVYSGSSWVNVGEVSGSTASLPNVPFSINYNAKEYNSSTKTLPKTSGQLVDIDAVITAGTPTVGDGYITIASRTRAVLSGYQTYFNRDANNPNITIVSKQTTNSSNPHLLANRASIYNWMYRANSSQLYFHGSSQNEGTLVTTQPVIESVRVDSNRLLTFNNYTDNTTSAVTDFSYGNTNTGGTALFAGYANTGSEWFVGDFYWIYMSQTTLTDEQIQQVIDYNEGNGTVVYPIYYDEIQDPPNNISFSSMTEAELYQCPWVGMKATIDGVSYTFSGDSQSGYEWVQNTSRLPSGYTEVEYIESPTTSEYPYINTNFAPNQNTRVIADLQYTHTNTHPRAFGCGAWNSTGYIFNAENGIGGSNASWKWKFGANSNNWLATNIQTDFDRHTVEINNGNLYLDNTLVGSTTVTTFQLSDNIGIFGFIYNGQLGGTSAGEYMTGKFYSFKIYDNGTLVRDFVPCTRDSDSKVGMYDIVNDVFYTSPNSYNFTAGNQV